MSLSLPLAVCLGGVFCFSLLALHLLRLAALNRGRRPTVVSARWDFAAMLVGLAGFLGVGGTAAAAAGQTVLAASRQPSLEAVRQQLDQTLAAGWWAGIAFAGLMVVSVSLACWNRRDSLEVYNIDPAAVGAVTADGLAAAGLPAGSPALAVTTTPRLCHATLRVRGLDPAATRDLLGHLRTQFLAGPTGDGVAGVWLTAVAAGLIGCTFVLVGVFYLYTRRV